MLTKVYNNVFTLSEKQGLMNLIKKKLQNTFSPVCLLLVQLALMNAFYSS